MALSQDPEEKDRRINEDRRSVARRIVLVFIEKTIVLMFGDRYFQFFQID